MKFFVKDLNTRTTKRLGKDFLIRLPLELESLDTIIEGPECFKYLPRKLKTLTWLDNMATHYSNGYFTDLPSGITSLLLSGLQFADWSNIPSRYFFSLPLTILASLVEMNIYNCGSQFVLNLPTTLTTLRTNSSACTDLSSLGKLASLQLSSVPYVTPSFPPSLTDLTFWGEIFHFDV